MRPAQRKRVPSGLKVPTVASLGVRARLVPYDTDPANDLADLLASCLSLQADVERLDPRHSDFDRLTPPSS